MKDDWSGFPLSIFFNVAQSLFGRVMLFYASLCAGLWLGAFTTDSEGVRELGEFPVVLIAGLTTGFVLAMKLNGLVGILYLGIVATVACVSFLRDGSVLKTSFLLVALQAATIYLARCYTDWFEPHEIPAWRPLLTFGIIGAIFIMWILARRRSRLEARS